MTAKLRLFNTLNRRLEDFEPIEEGQVRLYTCGPTIYDYPHIGNYRTFLFEDVLRRTLALFGYRVTQVQNLTDVDDRTIQRANENGSLAARVHRSFRSGLLRRPRRPSGSNLRSTIRERPSTCPRWSRSSSGWRPRATPTARRVRSTIGSAPFPAYGKLSGIQTGEEPRRSADRRRRLRQGRCAGFRALEGAERGRTGLGDRSRARSTRLAYRVLGHGDGAARRDLRHPLRRRRQHLPASRERDRPV